VPLIVRVCCGGAASFPGIVGVTARTGISDQALGPVIPTPPTHGLLLWLCLPGGPPYGPAREPDTRHQPVLVPPTLNTPRSLSITLAWAYLALMSAMVTQSALAASAPFPVLRACEDCLSRVPKTGRGAGIEQPP